jgi:hypothetical protein
MSLESAMWQTAANIARGVLARTGASAAFGMLTALACATSEPDTIEDAGKGSDIAAIDHAHVTSNDRDAPSDTAAGDGDVSLQPDASDDAKPSVDADATFADSIATDNARSDSTDGDGGCQCIPWVDGIVVTTSFECFLFGGSGDIGASPYETYVANPCAGLDPWSPLSGGARLEVSYTARNLIGIRTSYRGGSTSEYFYDATTKHMVGAARSSSYTGHDPLRCTPFPPGPGSRYVTVSAGILPDCNFTPVGFECSGNAKVLCAPRDAGAPDADAPDANAPDADSADSTDAAADNVDSADANSSDVLPDATDDAEASDEAAVLPRRTE